MRGMRSDYFEIDGHKDTDMDISKSPSCRESRYTAFRQDL